jgi:hypothetical protein
MHNTFFSFLIRVQKDPIAGFPVTLTSNQLKAVSTIVTALQRSVVDAEMLPLIHELSFIMISEISPETLADQWRCPFLRFLIAFHLADTNGNFVPVRRIPPNISKSQWCIRATSAQHILFNKHRFNGNTFE